MKRYYTNSRLARLLLLRGYSTITIGMFVFSKNKELSNRTKVHETIHVMQWFEVTIFSFIVIFFISLISVPWLVILSPFVYYALYIIEYICRLPSGNAYRNISFEKEAFYNHNDIHYIYERELFGWVKFL